MVKLTKSQKKYRWPDIETVLRGRIGAVKTAAIFAEAANLSNMYAANYKNLKGFEKTHVEAAYTIAAIYIPMKKELGAEKAIELIDEAWEPAARRKSARYDRLPPKLFMLLCRSIVKTAFGNKAGFKQTDRSTGRNEVRFDITFCPYVKIMQELGCSEACPIVCRQDEYSYGGMKGVIFERSMTLGRGDQKCDFCYRLGSKESPSEEIS